jgi:hypothetical protein
MALVVGIHGISQQLAGEEILEAHWAPSLRDGIRRSGRRAATALAILDRGHFRCAFYGDIFRPRGRHLSPRDDLGFWPEDATDYDHALVAELWARTAETDPAVMSPEARSLARAPRSLQTALRALSSSKFFAGMSERALFSDLTQVRRYFTEPATRGAVRQRVEAAVDETTRVIAGHSLGSIVAYEVLCEHPDWNIDLLLTLGSPLGIRNLIFDRLDPAPQPSSTNRTPIGTWPSSVRSWVNVADAHDVVALVKDLRPLFTTNAQNEAVIGHLIDNGAHAHDVSPYLTAPETGQAIADALLNSSHRDIVGFTSP